MVMGKAIGLGFLWRKYTILLSLNEVEPSMSAIDQVLVVE
jgi:hypothetical protein